MKKNCLIKHFFKTFHKINQGYKPYVKRLFSLYQINNVAESKFYLKYVRLNNEAQINLRFPLAAKYNCVMETTVMTSFFRNIWAKCLLVGIAAIILLNIIHFFFFNFVF